MIKLTKELVTALKNCDHGNGSLNPYHEEGSVWAHTIMVMENCNRFIQDNQNHPWVESVGPELRAAAVLHDLGKLVTRIITQKGWVAFPNHEAKGIEVIETYGLGKQIDSLGRPDLVYSGVANHDIYKYTVGELAERLSAEERLFCGLISMFDNRGRISNIAMECDHQIEVINGALSELNISPLKLN